MPPELDAMTPDMPPEPSGQIIGLHDGETDHEGEMAKADLYKLATYSFKLFKKIQDDDQLESWVQAKITKAADYIASVYHYLEYEMEFSEYGKKLENSDVYSESEKAEMLNKLTEARTKLAQLKIAQADKIKENTTMKMRDLINEAALSAKQKKIAGMEEPKDKIDAKDLADLRAKKKVKEGVLSGGHVECSECGGTGIVYEEPKQIPDHVKKKAADYDRKTKAMHAASKRLDKNNNGIPDDEENLDEGWDEMEADVKKRASEKGTGKFDKKEVKPGVTQYTRKSNTFTDGGDDSDTKKAKQKAKQKSSVDEAAKWRDAKHKDKLYTQEPRDYDQYDYHDADYYNGPKPDDYPGEKNLKGGGEFDHNDPLQKGYGRGGTGSMNTHGKRKGMPSRDHVSSLKGSIKAAHGTHPHPNLPEAAKPSAGLSAAKKSAVVKKAKAGGDIGKPGKSFDKVAKAAGGGEKGTKIAAAAMWKNVKEDIKIAEAEKKAKKDYDKDGKIETGSQEHAGSVDNAIKASKAKETIKESADLTRMKELMTRLNG
jgi:hypothetical protein